jgi:hypothetical protein
MNSLIKQFYKRAQVEEEANWCFTHRSAFLRLALVFISIVAPLRIGYEFWRLLFDASGKGAIDLKIFLLWEQAWFLGKMAASLLPPATHIMLWPFWGWLPLTAARWLWAATTVIAIGWLAHLLIQESAVKTAPRRLALLLFLLAIYPTGITIGNGQLILHLLPPLLAGLILLYQKPPSISQALPRERGREWQRELLASLLLLFSLLKPTVSAPFFWILLFACRAWRSFILVSIGYLALTFWALSEGNVPFTSFQDGLLTWFDAWQHNASRLAVDAGYANLHHWLGLLGAEEYILPASSLTLLLLGIWTYHYRDENLWLLLGVAALVARLWTYHRLYDDLLILIPIITLLGIAERSEGSREDRSGLIASILLTLGGMGLLAPGTLLRLPSPWGTPFRAGQAIIWILMFIFLLYFAWKNKHLPRNPDCERARFCERAKPRMGEGASV